MRDDKEGINNDHGLESGVVTCDGIEDGAKLLVCLIETPRGGPIDRKKRVGSVTLSDVGVTSKAKSIAECSTRSAEGSDG